MTLEQISIGLLLWIISIQFRGDNSIWFAPIKLYLLVLPSFLAIIGFISFLAGPYLALTGQMEWIIIYTYTFVVLLPIGYYSNKSTKFDNFLHNI